MVVRAVYVATGCSRQPVEEKFMKHLAYRILLALAVSSPLGLAHADVVKPLAALNMEMVGHNDLGGVGKGGEGLALKQYADGRRMLFLAHESGPACLSVIDVTRPQEPTLVTQINVEADFVRCNSLSLSGNTLAIAHQTEKVGQKYAGLDVYDVADVGKINKLSHFDTSGPSSRGVHFVWFVDGKYAYMSTGAADFVPRNPNDDQFLMIVDLSDPTKPHEIGRWWMPGTREGDVAAAPPRMEGALDSGIRMHTITIPAETPNRAYVGWIDGGWVILDITDKAHPQAVGARSWAGMGGSFAHTVIALPSRNLAVQSEEATKDLCKDWPKRNFTWDIKDEKHPFLLAVFAPAAGQDDLCKAGGRFGAHNIDLNKPMTPTSKTLTQTVVGSYFNGGVRIQSIADPSHPVEIGYLVPPAAPRNKSTIQINDVYVDENGLIYANDRDMGGLYIMRYTGTTPLQ
jgi:hypothetical protein